MNPWQSISLFLSRLVKDEPRIDSHGQIHHDEYPTAFSVVCFFITVFLLLGCCMQRARRRRGIARTEIPVTVYVNDAQQQMTPTWAWKEPRSCRICLDEMGGGQVVRVMPQCGHVYHRACIDEWLAASSDVCPLCRRRVIDLWQSGGSS